MIKHVLITLLFSTTLFAQLPKERRLRKLSMHIRGTNPSVKEYKEIGSVSDMELESFFEEKTREYLESPNHAKKMEFRLNQLFRLNLPGDNEYGARQEKNSLNHLFKKIAEQNLSWDKLLTGKEYKLFLHSYESKTDFGFLGAVLPFSDFPLVKSGVLNDAINDPLRTELDMNGNSIAGEYTRTHSFSQNDERIAGALTTERFFSRYVNTAVNKNRKRAAAVFRIFLCDDMEAAITDSSDRTDYILDFVFPNTSGMSRSDVSSISLEESAHGQRPDCMACHYKLDPMGKNFGGSGIALSPRSFKGALTYRSKDGEMINIPTNGLGDLGRELSQQKDYKACQTKHFWNWFIGEDRYLEPEVHQELISAYENVNGRVNDFINYLVNREEFYNIQSLSPEARLAFKVKGTLQNCNSCHSKEGLPSFTQWPIQNEEGDMKYWVGKISKSLGLDGGERTMPPKSHVWHPNEEDIEQINEWIRIGAPNEQGNRQLP